MGGWQRLIPNGVVAAYFRVKKLMKVGVRGTHSAQVLTSSGKNMQIHILPALSDNYMYLLIDEKSREAAIVDPVAPDTVIKAVADAQVKLTTILTTHHHWDHAGGNKELLQKVPGLAVLGGDDRIDGITQFVKEGDVAKIGNLDIKCYSTPCHTTGHICFYVTDSEKDEKVVFTGDTLFLGGCGRFFEGTAEQMYTALVEKLGSLPNDTKVYCGHEYSLQNLAYGAHVEPNNQAIQDKIKWARIKRDLSPAEPTVPSTIQEEKLINPFMRVEETTVQDHAGTPGQGGIPTMKALRAEKDNFKAK
jgi:hydroxyacylglutathione hydrolase